MVNAQEPRVRVEPRNTKGSTENVPLLEEGKVDLALVAGEIASAALAKPDTKLRIVAAMYSSPGMLMVRGDSPYRSLSDLRGKTVVMGTQASGVTALGRTVLESLSIPVNPIFLEKAADGPPMLMDGRADGLWGAGVGWPAFAALAKQGGRFIGPSSEEIKQILAKKPGAAGVTLPAKSYPGQDAPLPSVGLVELRARRPTSSRTTPPSCWRARCIAPRRRSPRASSRRARPRWSTPSPPRRARSCCIPGVRRYLREAKLER
jgi:TRAP transporter TAXI family solute receptor